ncbi:ATP-binding protein [Dyadobacter sp. CY356]|uniref:ATP-binding protein n=1 Tax=Dyadobacter sp. CY356 TaxID=2906442 RepID=UPI001F1CD9CA|nr:ATP-binding protein [Dyadobacter sp. CY356]MCF0059499.1 ATP-binding protein [Dyadobacter sp. CY356]
MNEPRRFIQVLMGPRQVGKTTVISQLLQHNDVHSHFVSADSVLISDAFWLEQQWEIARLKIKPSPKKEFLLIIDEIQKIGNWSEKVKLLWDADTREQRNIKVILLGSSRLLLQQGLTESLAGRFETIYMGHWSYEEMHTAFHWSTDQYAWFGGYPGSAELIDDEKRWKSYVTNSLIETSINRDILMLSRVAKPALMKVLFELGCHYSGQILSFTKIMGQLQDAGNTTTLSHYLNLLDTAGLLAGFEKYAADIIRKKSSSPKFQVHNTALISAQRAENFLQIKSDPTEWGRIVESAVGTHLLNNSLSENYKVYYWRDRDQEVDFVVEYKNQIVGIEVKSGAKQSSSGMAAFQKQFQPKKIYLIGDTGLPWQEFLRINPIELF